MPDAGLVWAGNILLPEKALLSVFWGISVLVAACAKAHIVQEYVKQRSLEQDVPTPAASLAFPSSVIKEVKKQVFYLTNTANRRAKRA
ncbi:MAG: hypothetical protein ACOCG6_04580 [Candidatus Cloacimonadaceae bacterium]